MNDLFAKFTFKDLGLIQIIADLTLESWEQKRMCEARVWNKLYSEEVYVYHENSKNSSTSVSLIAERSDYEVFKVVVLISYDESPIIIAKKIKKGYETLESYRNCDCTIAGGACIKHIKLVDTNLSIPIVPDFVTKMRENLERKGTEK